MIGMGQRATSEAFPVHEKGKPQRHATLIDRYLPCYEFEEVHRIRVHATPSRTLAAIAMMRLDEDVFVEALLRVRGAPMALIRTTGARKSPRPRFSLKDFTPLGAIGEHEIAWGLIGRFWRLGGGHERLDSVAAFERADLRGRAKLVWCFRTLLDGDTTILVTRTRVHCPDLSARILFGGYWTLIRAPSGFTRRRLLSSIRQRAEGRPVL